MKRKSGPKKTAGRKRPIDRLLQLMAQLRSPRGCPWDREQTHESIKRNLIEECYEVVDAIDSGDDEALREELGDLLLQIAFHSQIAQEQDRFNFQDVAASIAQKLRRRHPHVFGEKKLDTADQVLSQWHAIKKTEKQAPGSVLDGVPKRLPALMKAQEIQRKAARVGFDWKSTEDVLSKVEEELAELKRAMRRKSVSRIQEEMGDLFFALVNLARFSRLDAEETLRRAVEKFRGRFERIERALAEQGKRPEDCSLEKLEALWNRTKRK